MDSTRKSHSWVAVEVRKKHAQRNIGNVYNREKMHRTFSGAYLQKYKKLVERLGSLRTVERCCERPRVKMVYFPLLKM